MYLHHGILNSGDGEPRAARSRSVSLTENQAGNRDLLRSAVLHGTKTASPTARSQPIYAKSIAGLI